MKKPDVDGRLDVDESCLGYLPTTHLPIKHLLLRTISYLLCGGLLFGFQGGKKDETAHNGIGGFRNLQ